MIERRRQEVYLLTVAWRDSLAICQMRSSQLTQGPAIALVSWMVVEYSMIDWRPAARRTDAYDLLSRARLEVVTEGA